MTELTLIFNPNKKKTITLFIINQMFFTQAKNANCASAWFSTLLKSCCMVKHPVQPLKMVEFSFQTLKSECDKQVTQFHF